MKKSTSSTKAPAPAKSTAKTSRKTTASAAKKAPVKAPVTSISAQIDVGFGNALYVRGDGPGLSWEKGVVMTCVAPDRWAVDLMGVKDPVVCKFLLNDLIWCTGEDFVVGAGARASFVPVF